MSISLQVDSQPRSVGLVWGLVAAWRSVCIHQMNRVNSHNGLTMIWNIGISIIIIIIIKEAVIVMSIFPSLQLLSPRGSVMCTLFS